MQTLFFIFENPCFDYLHCLPFAHRLSRSLFASFAIQSASSTAYLDFCMSSHVRISSPSLFTFMHTRAITTTVAQVEWQPITTHNGPLSN